MAQDENDLDPQSNDELVGDDDVADIEKNTDDSPTDDNGEAQE